MITARTLEAARATVPTIKILSGIRLAQGDQDCDWFKSDRYYQFYVALASLVKPASVLEVGVRYGYSLVAMLRGHPGITQITGIDNQTYIQNSNLAATENVWLAGFKGDVRIINGESVRELSALPKNSFDLVHLDGDHGQEGVRQDVLAAWPLLRVGGTLVIDDTVFAPDASYGIEAARPHLDIEGDFYFNTFRGWWIARKRG